LGEEGSPAAERCSTSGKKFRALKFRARLRHDRGSREGMEADLEDFEEDLVMEEGDTTEEEAAALA
jgi:hypothetical protein